MIINIFESALADAALDVLPGDQPFQAGPDNITDLQSLTLVRGIRQLVLRVLGVAGPEEGQGREGADADVVVSFSGSGALRSRTTVGEVIRAPAAVGILMPGQPMERVENRLPGIAGLGILAIP